MRLRGEWMQTFTGKAFYPLHPVPSDIVDADIAHALSLICRYGGHVRRFYSVAEHCVLLSRAVSPENALWALLHDATEAYVGDMIRPLKVAMPEYVRVEDRLMDVIAQRYDIGPEMPVEVKEADSRILLNEREALLGTPPRAWDVDGLQPLLVQVEGWNPDRAEHEYAERLTELLGGASRT